MDQVVPWAQLLKVIRKHYPKAGSGRPPLGLEKMLRIYFLQQWFNLSDPAMEDALYDIESLRRFAGVELGQDEIPDETTILKFRHLLERHNLTKKLFAQVTAHLEEKKLLLRAGTIVTPDVSARARRRTQEELDPEEQHQKGQIGFLPELHVGTVRSGGRIRGSATAKYRLAAAGRLFHGQRP